MILIEGRPTGNGISRHKHALTCLRYHGFADVAELRSSGNPPQVEGTLLHAGLAQHYARMGAAAPGGLEVTPRGELRAIKVTKATDIATPDMGVDASAEEQPEGCVTHAMVERIKRCIAAYIVHYPMDSKHWRVIGVESVFAFTVDGQETTPRVDLVVENTHGAKYIVDHKGTGRITSVHARHYAMDLQFLTFQWMGRQAYGHNFGGVLLNLVQRTEPFRFTRTGLDAAPALVEQVPSIIAEAQRRVDGVRHLPVDQWPPTPTELVCYHRYGACDFIDRCRFGG